jgi:hypothetical protein
MRCNFLDSSPPCSTTPDGSLGSPESREESGVETVRLFLAKMEMEWKYENENGNGTF